MYEKLISFLPELESGKVQSGLWHSDPEADGSEEHPYVLPFVVYGRVARELEEEIYRIVQEHPELNLNHYYDVLKERGVDWNGKEMEAADVSDWDGQGVLALMVGIIRAERFSDGTYKQFLENGCFAKWIRRLKELDDAEKAKQQPDEKKATVINSKADDRLVRYSMQLAYLKTLLSEKLITENEYSRIKKKLMKDYGIASDILSDFKRPY